MADTRLGSAVGMSMLQLLQVSCSMPLPHALPLRHRWHSHPHATDRCNPNQYSGSLNKVQTLLVVFGISLRSEHCVQALCDVLVLHYCSIVHLP